MATARKFHFLYSVLFMCFCNWANAIPETPNQIQMADWQIQLTNLTEFLVVDIEPVNEVKVVEGYETVISLWLKWNTTLADFNVSASCPANLTVEPNVNGIVAVINGTIEADLAGGFEWNITIQGIFLGYANLNVYLEWINQTTPCYLTPESAFQFATTTPEKKPVTTRIPEVVTTTTTTTTVHYSDLIVDDLTTSPPEVSTDLVPKSSPTTNPTKLITLQKIDFDIFDPSSSDSIYDDEVVPIKSSTPKIPPRNATNNDTQGDQHLRLKVGPSKSNDAMEKNGPIVTTAAAILPYPGEGEPEGSSMEMPADILDDDDDREESVEDESMPETAFPLQQAKTLDKDPEAAQETVAQDVPPDYLMSSDKSLELPAVESSETKPEKKPETPKPTIKWQDKSKSIDKDQQVFENIYSEGATYQTFRRRRRSIDDPETEVLNTKRILVPVVYRVGVLRDTGILDLVFIILISVVVCINTFMMGCQLDLTVVKAVFKKPIGPIVGFVSQFMFMPLASYGLGMLFFTDVNLQLGLFALGCSPGGNGSNFWTLLLNGDLNLSITMTFISTVCAIFMMPFWLFTLGQNILDRGKIEVPFGNLLMSLLMFTVPLSIGILIRHFKPTWAAFTRKIIRPFTFCLLFIMPVLGIANSLFLFQLITWQTIVAGICIAWGGYVFGATLAWICRMKRPQIIAVSIETAIQNAGVAFMVLRLTLGQPDADLSSVSPISQLFVTTLPLLAVYIPLMIYRKCKACRKKNQDAKDQEAALKSHDIDSVNPLVVKRQYSLPKEPARTEQRTSEFKGKPAVTLTTGPDVSKGTKYTPVNSQEPVYANMYMEYDDSTLNKMYDKPALTMKQSLDDQPIREDDHEFKNFRKSRRSEFSDGASPETGDELDGVEEESGFYEAIN